MLAKAGGASYGFHINGASVFWLARRRRAALSCPSGHFAWHTIRRKPVQNIVEFHIIGRLGRIDAAKNVTHISVATNYNRREGETWKSDPQWHRITLFGGLRERIAKTTIGDLVRITGRIGQSSCKVEGETR